MNKKRIKKRKLNVPKLLVFLLIVYLIVYLIFKVLNANIKNIYIINNNLVTDQEIIELADLSDYPSLLFTSSKKIVNSLKTNKLISNVKVKKGMDKSITIDVTEYQVLFYDELEKMTVLENGSKLNTDNIYSLPILINNVITDTYNKLIKKFVLIDYDIRGKISEIKYCPNDVDDERFLFTMNDGNYVYITLTKIKNINNYDDILPSLEGKKGILYLDSGQYFEIFK